MAGDAAARRYAPLSPRERELMEAYADLGNRKAAARRLGITLNTAKHYLTTIYIKLGVRSNSEAFTKLGWLRRKR